MARNKGAIQETSASASGTASAREALSTATMAAALVKDTKENWQGATSDDGQRPSECNGLEHHQLSAMQGQLSALSEEVIELRRDLRSLQKCNPQSQLESLAASIDEERKARVTAIEQCQLSVAEVSAAIVEERTQRNATFDELSDEVRRCMLTRSFRKVSEQQEEEAAKQSAMESQMRQALQSVRVEIEEQKEAMRDKLSDGIKHMEVLAAVDNECAMRAQECRDIRFGMHECIEDMCKWIEDEVLTLQRALESEANARSCGNQELRRWVVKLLNESGEHSRRDWEDAAEDDAAEDEQPFDYSFDVPGDGTSSMTASWAVGVGRERLQMLKGWFADEPP